MKNIKFILKGMLLWVTAFTVLFFISGIDGLVDNGYFIQSLITIAIMVYTCYKLISGEELKKITMYKWTNKLMRE